MHCITIKNTYLWRYVCIHEALNHVWYVVNTTNVLLMSKNIGMKIVKNKKVRFSSMKFLRMYLYSNRVKMEIIVYLHTRWNFPVVTKKFMMNDEGDIHKEQLNGFKGMESIVLEEMWILFNVDITVAFI